MNRTARMEALVEIGGRLADLVTTANRLEHSTAVAADYRREYDLLKQGLRTRIFIPRADDPRLTPRERQVVELAANGKRGLTISRELGISRGTVKLHLKNARQKTRVYAVRG